MRSLFVSILAPVPLNQGACQESQNKKEEVPQRRSDETVHFASEVWNGEEETMHGILR